MRRSSLFSVIAIAVFYSAGVVLPCSGEVASTKTLWIAHYKVDCVGVAPQKCFLIKEGQYDEWSLWYGDIEGFDFEPGYAYEIRVAEEPVENPPADAPSVRLRLLEVVIKVPAFEPPESAALESSTPDQTEAPVTEPPDPTPRPLQEPSELEPAPTPPARPAPPAIAPPAPTSAPTPPPVTPQTRQTQPEFPSADYEAFRGHLTIGPGLETRSFKMCGHEQSFWVEDGTGDDLWSLYRRMSGYPNRPLYMRVRGQLQDPPATGFGSHYGKQLVIRELRYAATESAGCFEDLSRFMFRAQGNEPAWHVEISRSGIAFSEMGGAGNLYFSYNPPVTAEDRLVYWGSGRVQEPRTIQISLTQQPCDDTMADTRYSFQAIVMVGDRELAGCALQGQQAPD